MVARVGIAGGFVLAVVLRVVTGGRAVGTGLLVVTRGGLVGMMGLFVVSSASSQYCPSSKKYIPSGQFDGKACPPEHLN